MTYKAQTFISAGEAAVRTEQAACRLGVWSGPAFWVTASTFSLCPQAEGAPGLWLCGASYKGPHPIHGAPPSWTNHLPKGPPPSAITLGVRFQYASFGGHLGRAVGWVMSSYIQLSRKGRDVPCPGQHREKPTHSVHVLSSCLWWWRMACCLGPAQREAG